MATACIHEGGRRNTREAPSTSYGPARIPFSNDKPGSGHRRFLTTLFQYRDVIVLAMATPTSCLMATLGMSPEQFDRLVLGGQHFDIL